MLAKRDLLEEVSKAKRIIVEGGPVEEAVKMAHNVAYKATRELLSRSGGLEEGLSLTEMAYRLLERAIIDEDTSIFLRELARMPELAHYDIYALYTREQLLEKFQSIELLVKGLV